VSLYWSALGRRSTRRATAVTLGRRVSPSRTRTLVGGAATTADGLNELLLLLDVRLPVSDHVVAVAEALLAEVADEGAVAVLERRARAGRAWPDRRHDSSSHGGGSSSHPSHGSGTSDDGTPAHSNSHAPAASGHHRRHARLGHGNAGNGRRGRGCPQALLFGDGDALLLFPDSTELLLLLLSFVSL
jgi:hypothetical protein